MKHSLCRTEEGGVGLLGELLFLFYVASVAFPLFVMPAYRATNLTLIFDPHSPASHDPQPLRIHWVILPALLVCVYFALCHLARRRLRAPRRTKLVVTLSLAFSAALVAGMFVHPGILNVVYFGQTLLPLVGFFVGACLAGTTARLRRALLVLVAATTLSILGILALALSYGVFTGDVVAANLLARHVPQVRNYFPFVVAASLAAGLGIFPQLRSLRARALLGIALGVHLVFYTVNWSRMGFVMLAVVIAFFVLSWMRSGPRISIRSRIVLVSALLGLALGGSLLLARFGVFTMRRQHFSFAQSDNSREHYAIEATKLILDEPLFGRMFIADWKRDPYLFRKLRIPRIFKAHNQYLDYGVRAGLPAVVVLFWIMWVVSRDLRRTLRELRGSRASGPWRWP